MRLLASLFVLLATCGGGSSRSTFAHHPGGPPAFDRKSATPEALDIADKVLAAAGGAAAWEKAKQIRWHQEILRDGKPVMSGDQAWDRWNERHWAKIDRDKGAQGVMYEIYGTKGSGFIEYSSGGRQPVGTGDASEGIKAARSAWQRDTTITFAAFLLFEPGAKIEYSGTVKDGDAEYHDLKLTFDPADTARTGLIVHIYADKDKYVIQRVSLETPDGNKFAYTLEGYQNVNGLQLSTERKNLGSGELVKLKDIKVSEPDDDLWIAPIS